MKKNMKKNMMLLSLMAAAIMMPLSATAQTRIAVVSDIHVMDPRLLPAGAENTTAWKTYYADQRKMLEQSADLFNQFVTTMIAQKPNILLITGDLTKDGEQLSHDCVKAGLQTLESNEIQVYVIPGNHDFGAEGNHTQFKADGTTENAPVLSTDEFASFYTGYGYGTGSTIDPNGSLSYVAEPVTGLVLLAIDSHSGSVGSATLTWICNQALSARANGKRVIAMMHHPLFPHIEGADMFISTYTVANYVTVRNALINAGVNVILTGHFHTSDIAYDWNNSQTNGIYDINTGSLISYPCDYRILDLSEDKSTLNVNTYSLPETEALRPTESETKVTWKNWLHDRVKTIATNKMNYASMGVAIFSTKIANAITNIALFAADLFILHAEGDENSKDEREELKNRYEGFKENKETVTIPMGTYEVYPTVFEYGGVTDESIYSILTDISNYVDGELMSDHENRTADRTLTVTLTNPGTLLLDNGADNSTAINCYNGKEATVTLTGRTFYKDGAWNTICLPFSMTSAQIAASDLAGATIKELDPTGSYSYTDGNHVTGIDSQTGTLYLNFKDATADNNNIIKAGAPYIFKWASSGTHITDPSFTGVTINNTAPEGVTSSNGTITFIGTYAWQKFTDENKRILLIGINTGMSTLFYPEANASLGACRAYFQLADDYTAGEPDTPGPGPGIRNFVLNFGDDDSATGIIAIGDSQSSTLNAQRSEWFTLDGRRLAAKPTAKGLYIHAGRKVVIK